MKPWSKSRDTVDKLTVGSMARYTLASYADRDANCGSFSAAKLSRHGSRYRVPLAEKAQAGARVQIGALRRDSALVPSTN